MKSGGTRRQTTLRRILVYGAWQFSCQSREKLFLGEPRLLHQRGQHILSDSLLELRRRNLLVGARSDLRFRRLPLSIFRELFEQLAEATTEQTADARTAQNAAQTTWQAALRLRLRAAISLGSRPRHAVEHFGELVSILISRERKHSKKCSHRWHSTAHVRLLCCLHGLPFGLPRNAAGPERFGKPPPLGVANLTLSIASEPLLARRHLDSSDEACS